MMSGSSGAEKSRSPTGAVLASHLPVRSGVHEFSQNARPCLSYIVVLRRSAHRGGWSGALKGEHLQPWNLLEVAGVQRGYRGALLNRGRTAQKGIGRERDALGCLLSAELAGDFRCVVGDGVHRDILLQFIDEGTARRSDLRSVGAHHAMHEFRKGNC